MQVPVVWVVVEPAEIVTIYAAQHAGERLVCEPLVDDLVTCYRTASDKGWTYVTETWARSVALDRADLAALARDLGRRAWATQGWVALTGEGQGLGWQAGGGDHAEAVWLLPELLPSCSAGTTAVVAVPTHGAMLSWCAGAAEADRMLAVGVRRCFDEAAHQVSPVVYRWSGGAWVRWGEAQPRAAGVP